MPCGIRSQPLRDLDQVVGIGHRFRSLCCFEQVQSVRVIRDQISEGWASGYWGRTSVHPFPTIPTGSSMHDVLVNKFMDSKLKTVWKVDLGASSGADGWKDVLQLLREKSEKMEKFLSHRVR